MKIMNYNHSAIYRFTFFVFFFSSNCFSQTNWSLDSCIEIALRNSLTQKMDELNIDILLEKKNQTVYNFLPTLNGAGTHGYIWGQSIDQFTNSFASSRVQSNNFFLQGQWTIYNGLQNFLLKSKAEAEFANQELNTQIQKRIIKIEITSLYLDVLLNYQIINLAKFQIKSTKEMLEKNKKMFDLGYESEYKVIELKSQLTKDSLRFLQSKNELNKSKLKLRNALNIEELKDFDVTEQILNNDTIPKLILIDDLTSLSEFKQVEKQLEIAQYNTRLAKSVLLPRLSLTSSLGSGYSSNKKIMIDNEFSTIPFSTQFNDNLYTSAILTLNIPIYNKGVISTIKQAKIEELKSELKKEIVTQKIKSQLDEIQLNIENTKLEKDVVKNLVLSTTKLYEMAKLSYEQGDITFYETTITLQEQFNANLNLLQIEFKEYFNYKILDFLTE